MPLPNRVTPSGDLEASSARGLLFGNRGGRFHDVATQSIRGRPWASRHWIICQCDFKGRAARFRDSGRLVWDGSRYTELFFSDDVTALAAGHRPCMECRRDEAMAYRRAVVTAGAFATVVPCPALDAQLDRERRTGHAKRLHSLPYDGLPDGAMVRIGAAAHAVKGGRLLVWSQDGYKAAIAIPRGIAACLTPPTSLAALRGGYQPVWHPSATLIGAEPD